LDLWGVTWGTLGGARSKLKRSRSRAALRGPYLRFKSRALLIGFWDV